MESIWIQAEKRLLENANKLDEKIETEVCIIGDVELRLE